ncbi:hypothetical protein [Novosphingobium sp. P6W]|uniref:hypothetical protein n=1 Tax=Novosphingobium sp. P6W TaxID=1609758 RepID=UPI0005C70ABF|nr:hypothetical protein [Novosphingobium sp. P6W]
MVAVLGVGPQDLEATNINLVSGNPYSGVCSVDQFHLFRPFDCARNHRTPRPGGGSGHHVVTAIG